MGEWYMVLGWYALRAVYFFALLLLILRWQGIRFLASFTLLERASGFALGTMAGAGIVDMRFPVAGVTLGMVVFAVVGSAATRLAQRSPSLARLLIGSPTQVIREGRWLDEGLRRLQATRSELAMRLREGRLRVQDVETAWMEPDGRLSWKERQGSGRRGSD